jgi:hypothetical protein
MSQKIGEREAWRRRMREERAKPKISAKEIAKSLPATSGKKPVKRRRHR